MACSWCKKPGCHPARPLCRKMRQAQEKYHTCECGGYPFPHRLGSLCCYANPNHQKAQWERNTGLPWEPEEP